MQSLWLFPGQGSQHAGMLESLSSDDLALVQQTTHVALQDTDAAYQDSVQIQLSILALQLKQIQLLQQRGWQPDAVAGHSLGIFAAAVAAKVLTPEVALKLVHYRAKLMQTAYPNGYGMGVVVGLTRNQVTTLVQQVTTDEQPVYASNQNALLQTTLSGSLTGIQQVLKLAKAAGAQKALKLKVPVPSHSPLMTEVAQHLTTYVQQLPLADPQCAYLANWNGHRLRTAGQVGFDLANNLRYPVYWDTMMAVGQELGTNVSVEFAPGHAFTKLFKAKFPTLSTLNLTDLSIDDADFLLNKWKEVL